MELMSQPLLKLGDNAITWWHIIYIAVLSLLLLIATTNFQKLILKAAGKQGYIDIGIANSISVLAKYVCLAIGFIVILQTAGINLSSLTIIAAGMGLGLTVGLQNIIANFMSGLTLFMERPIKVGDRVEVDGVLGDITKITMRSTTVCTNENIEIIVPNTHFITGKVTNWSHSSPNIRLSMPLGVAYQSNPREVRRIVEEVAAAHPGVLKDPPPELIFTSFGESALLFTLWVWTCDYTRQPFVLKSDLYYEIFDRLKKEGVEIPYPQRDVHIRSGTLATLADLSDGGVVRQSGSNNEMRN